MPVENKYYIMNERQNISGVLHHRNYKMHKILSV